MHFKQVETKLDAAVPKVIAEAIICDTRKSFDLEVLFANWCAPSLKKLGRRQSLAERLSTVSRGSLLFVHRQTLVVDV